MSLLLGACVTLSTPPLQVAPGDFVDGTRVLAIVEGVFTRAQIVETDDPPETTWRNERQSIGLADDDITDGSEIFGVSFCWAQGSLGDCGYYMAHVPPELQGTLHTTTFSPAGVKEGGDIVEIELKRTASGKLAGLVVARYRAKGDWRDCKIDTIRVHKGAQIVNAVLSMSTPTGGWIACDGLPAEGWLERPAAGQPPVTPLSGRDPENYVREWVKPP